MATVTPRQMDPDTAYIRWDEHCALLAPFAKPWPQSARQPASGQQPAASARCTRGWQSAMLGPPGCAAIRQPSGNSG